MYIDLAKQPLPKIYTRKGRECYLDPIRKKLIYITPEETVRQKVISHLLYDLDVPADMISVEENLSHYGIKSIRRTDITIKCLTKDGDLIPVAVIECKAPGIGLGDKVAEQLSFYSDTLGCDYAMMINDIEYQCYHYNEATQRYDLLEKLPCYADILENKYTIQPVEEQPPRPAFEEISKIFKENPAAYDMEISPATEHNLACAAFNLLTGLFDDDHKFPYRQYGAFNLIEDYGVRMLTYGNAGGGMFYGPYRSFLIERNGSTEFVSFGFSTYGRSEKPSDWKTALNIAIDNEKESHHALQLSIDDNVVYQDGKVTFYHSGRIAIGNKGSGKVRELRTFVESRYPEIISENRFNLGVLEYNRNWNMDDPDVVKLIENLITYALIRDEYRVFVKEQR